MRRLKSTKEPLGGQPLEMVGGSAALNAHSVGCLVAGARVVVRNDVVLEGATVGFIEADRSELVGRRRLCSETGHLPNQSNLVIIRSNDNNSLI